jgi:hypothetical protein
MSPQSALRPLNVDFTFKHHAGHTGALLNGSRRSYLGFEFHGTATVRQLFVPGYIIVCTFIAIDIFIAIDPFAAIGVSCMFHFKIVSDAVRVNRSDDRYFLWSS